MLWCIISHEISKRVLAIAMVTKALLPLQMQHLKQTGAVLICVPLLTAVYFRDSEGPWATLSSPCYCLPRWARMPYFARAPPMLFSPSLTLPLFLFLPCFHCLCSSGTCGPTEALSYTKKPNCLSSEVCYQLCALCNCASLDFTRDTVIIIGFESLRFLQEHFLLSQLQRMPLISY